MILFSVYEYVNRMLGAGNCLACNTKSNTIPWLKFLNKSDFIPIYTLITDLSLTPSPAVQVRDRRTKSICRRPLSVDSILSMVADIGGF